MRLGFRPLKVSYLIKSQLVAVAGLSLAANCHAQINNPYNAHQIGINPLAFVSNSVKEPFGEEGFQTAYFFYRYLNKANLNPYFHFGASGSKKQSGIDPETGNNDVDKVSNSQFQGGVDHRIRVTNRIGLYLGVGWIYYRRYNESYTLSNTGSDIQKTSTATEISRNGVVMNAVFEYCITQKWRISTRCEYRKTLESEVNTYTNTLYSNLNMKKQTDRIHELLIWPFQLCINYNFIKS